VRLLRTIGILAAVVALARRATANAPLRARREKGWREAAGVAGATATLIALDPLDTPYFQRTAFQQTPAVVRFNQVLSGRNTALAIAAVPLTFYVAGLIRKDSYARHTAFLAGDAVSQVEVVAILMKDIDRRMRPNEIEAQRVRRAPPGGSGTVSRRIPFCASSSRARGSLSGTWFRSQSRSIGGRGSFPSGHTAAAFAVATVFAQRYRSRGWAPWAVYGLAYGSASLIGLSRITGKHHFPSDVFGGAVLGYSISRFIVLP